MCTSDSLVAGGGWHAMAIDALIYTICAQGYFAVCCKEAGFNGGGASLASGARGGGGRRGGTGGELGGNWAMFVGDDRERGCRAEAFDVYDLICSIFPGFGVVIIEAEGWWSCGRGNLYEGCDRSAVRGEESF